MIPPAARTDADFTVARRGSAPAAGAGAPHRAEGIRALLGDRTILIFVATVVLFHAANAAMLPLVGERLGGDRARSAPLYMSAVIVVAQCTMVPVDIVLARFADRLRHKPIFLAGFAAAKSRAWKAATAFS